MPIALNLRALTNSHTQQPLAYPAIDMRSGALVDEEKAYQPAASGQAEIFRPNRSLRRVLDYLAKPQTASLSLAERRQGAEELVCCPVFMGPFVDPVVLADGETLSFPAVMDWWQAQQELAAENYNPFVFTSPLTRQPLADTRLIRDDAMRALMAELGIEVDHGPEHSYALPEVDAPRLNRFPVLDAEVRTSIRPASPATSLASRSTLGGMVLQFRAIDEGLRELAYLLPTSHARTLRGRWKKKQLIKQLDKLTDRALSQPGASVTALCRRGADYALLMHDDAKAMRYVTLGLESDPNSRTMLSRLAFIHAKTGLGSVNAAKEALSRFFDVDASEALDACAVWIADNRNSPKFQWPLLPTYGLILACQGDFSQYTLYDKQGYEHVQAYPVESHR